MSKEQELKSFFEKVFNVKPDMCHYHLSLFYAVKVIPNPFVRLRVEEVAKRKFRGWRFNICYDEDDLCYCFEKYEEKEDKVYKFTVEIFIL
jgi:hypothetical protein